MCDHSSPDGPVNGSRDFNIKSVSVLPRKADSELLVDPNAKLTFSVALQCLKSIARRNAKVVQPCGQLD